MKTETTNQTCDSCGKPIQFLIYEKTGKPNPIDLSPQAAGNIEIDTDAGTYRILTAAQVGSAKDLKLPLYLSHFATCPNAQSFRKPAAKKTESKTMTQAKEEFAATAATLKDVVKASDASDTLPPDLTPELANRLMTHITDTEIFTCLPYDVIEVSHDLARLSGQLSTLGYIKWSLSGDKYLYEVYPKGWEAFGKTPPEPSTERAEFERDRAGQTGTDLAAATVADNLNADYAAGTATAHPAPEPTVTVTIEDNAGDPTPPEADDSLIPVYKEMLYEYRKDVVTLEAKVEPDRAQAELAANLAHATIMNAYREKHSELLDTLQTLINDRTDTEQTLRELLIDWHKATGTKTYDKDLQVAVLPKTKILDMKAAIEWAKINSPVCLVLDEKKFLELFGNDELPFIEKKDTYSAKIAKNLTPPEAA